MGHSYVASPPPYPFCIQVEHLLALPSIPCPHLVCVLGNLLGVRPSPAPFDITVPLFVYHPLDSTVSYVRSTIGLRPEDLK